MLIFRVGKEDKSGLWYDQSGNFTGLIHNELNFCSNSNLEMPFREEFVGKLSCTTDIVDLFKWFNNDDLINLKSFGYKILIYTIESKFVEYNEEFKHHLASQNNVKLVSSFNSYSSTQDETIKMIKKHLLYKVKK